MCLQAELLSMPGILALHKQNSNTSVRIAVPDFIGVRDPAFTSGVGIIQYVSKYMRSATRFVFEEKCSKESN